MTSIAPNRLAVPRLRPQFGVGNSRTRASESRNRTASWLTVGTVVLVTGVMGYRLHEVFPAMRVIKPAVTLGYLPAVVLLVVSWSQAKQNMGRDGIFRLLIAFVIFAVASAPFAMYKGLAVDSLVAFGTVLAVAAAFATLPRNSDTADRVLLGLAGLGAGLGASAVLFGSKVGRLSVTSSLDPNDLAALMVVTFFLTFGLLRRGGALKRVFASGVLLLAAIVIVRTSSRGAMLGLAGGALLLVIATPGLKRLVTALAILAIGALGWQYSPPDFKDRIASLASLDDDYNETAYGGRKQIWKRGLTYVQMRPLLGAGIGNYTVAEGEELERRGMRGKWSTAHNAYLQVAVEIGVPGFIVFMLLWLASLRAAWVVSAFGGVASQRLQRPELLAALGGLAVCSFFLSLAYQPALYALFFAASLSAGAARQEHRSSDRLPTNLPRGAVSPRAGGTKRAQL